jgi:transcriptional regulator with XRE-family HTH domain
VSTKKFCVNNKKYYIMMQSKQIRAARSLLGWNQSQLSDASGVNVGTIKRMEKDDEGLQNAYNKNVIAVQSALEKAGIEFIPENGGGVGVRLKSKG